MHKLAHEIGIHDHYCYNSSADDPTPCSNAYCRSCHELSEINDLMGSTRPNIDTIPIDSLLCNICLDSGYDHLEDHH